MPPTLSVRPTRRVANRWRSWLTSADNQYFASSYVNRLWGYLLGVGMIEPIDDMRAGNPPTNPELLEYLTQEFVARDFDVRQVIRLICQSRTYQLSIGTNRWNQDDDRNYSHAKARRLPAEVLLDAVDAVTGTRPEIPGTEPGTRAVQLADSQQDVESGFLANLGRPPRESACECERVSDLHLGAVMSLLNGPEIAQAIGNPSNRIAELVQQLDDDRALDRCAIRPRVKPARHGRRNRCRNPQLVANRARSPAIGGSNWPKRNRNGRFGRTSCSETRLQTIRQAERELADYQPIHEVKQQKAAAEQQVRIEQASQQLDAWRERTADACGRLGADAAHPHAVDSLAAANSAASAGDRVDPAGRSGGRCVAGLRYA